MLVLNDNGMSISRNVGALSKQLTRLRISRGWLGVKKNLAEALRKVPGVGERLHDAFQKVKNGIRNAFIRDKFFTSLGFQYFGPIDGHDIIGLEKVFRSLKNVDHPVVIHVVTKKGCGFDQAEEAPENTTAWLRSTLKRDVPAAKAARRLAQWAGIILRNWRKPGRIFAWSPPP